MGVKEVSERIKGKVVEKIMHSEDGKEVKIKFSDGTIFRAYTAPLSKDDSSYMLEEYCAEGYFEEYDAAYWCLNSIAIEALKEDWY